MGTLVNLIWPLMGANDQGFCTDMEGKNLPTSITRLFSILDRFWPTLFLVEVIMVVLILKTCFSLTVFKSTPVHSMVFMLSRMCLVSNSKRGVIAIGGLITSIAHVLHLDTELAILVPFV